MFCGAGCVTVPAGARAHAVPADPAVREPDGAAEGGGADPERHGPLPQGLQLPAGAAAQHHGRVRQGALAGLEGEAAGPGDGPYLNCLSPNNVRGTAYPRLT